MIYIAILLGIINLSLTVIVYLQLKQITGVGIQLPFLPYGDRYI
jgi:hypothetical protein